MSDFVYRMRVLLALNGVAVISAATMYALMDQGLFANVLVWVVWFALVQAIGFLFMTDRNISSLFPDHVAEVIDNYRQQAEAGDRVSSFVVGQLYEEGIGVTMDVDEAKRWYRRAAAADLPEAQDSLRRLEAA
jgi:hypothetical protein